MMNYLSSSDDDVEEVYLRNEVPKNKDFYEEVVPLMTGEQYREHFRLSRELTVQLAGRYETSEYYHYQQGDSTKMDTLKIMMAFLWFIGNESATFRDVSDRFGVTRSTLHKVVIRVIYFLSNLSPGVITWPDEEEKVEIERHFADKDFPGVIGVIDGTHIQINKPQEDPDSYLNRKHFYSIQAQVVCDHSRRIRDLFVGYPGSVHDSRVLRVSPLYETLPQLCTDEYFIIGDSGYPCLKHLLTPFKDRGNLTRRQRNYNHLLSKNRYVVEHCFGIMKQKFRQLYHVKLRNIRVIVHLIRACAVLHNLSLSNELVDIGNDRMDNENHQDRADVQEQHADDREGVLKRNEVMNNIPFRI